MLATIMSAIPFLRGFKPRRGLYDNPYPALSDKAIAWAKGRAGDDSDKNPYPEGHELWRAWKEGDLIRQRVETTIW